MLNSPSRKSRSHRDNRRFFTRTTLSWPVRSLMNRFPAQRKQKFMEIKLDRNNLKGFIEPKDYQAILPAIQKAHNDLENKTGKGSALTGWLDLPSRMEDSFLEELV